MALTPYVQSNSWVTRPRSAEPYSGTYLQASYRPSPIQAVCDPEHDFLAGLTHEVYAKQVHEEVIIEEWIATCPDTDPRFGNYLTRDEVRSALVEIMSLVNAAQHGELDVSIQHCILVDLEWTMQSDLGGGLGLGGRGPRDMTFECQHLFRSLSYASYRCRSRLLGKVLHGFFTQQIRLIAQNNDRKSLWQWCRAITDSAMDSELQRDCLSRLQIHRPDVFVQANTTGSERAIRQLRRLVRELVEMVRGGQTSPSGRRRRQSRSRPLLGWAGSDDDGLQHPDDDVLRDQEALEIDLRYHEEEAERNRQQLAQLGVRPLRNGRSSGSLPMPYSQRRSALQNSWNINNLWPSNGQ